MDASPPAAPYQQSPLELDLTHVLKPGPWDKKHPRGPRVSAIGQGRAWRFTKTARVLPCPDTIGTVKGRFDDKWTDAHVSAAVLWLSW